MKKYLTCLILVSALLSQCASSFAAQKGNALAIAVKKYRSGNYIGCIQDCQRIVRHNPSNQIAYYYLAISYTQAGKRKEAIAAYDKILTLRPSAELLEYTKTGRDCLKHPELCYAATANADLEKFVHSRNQRLSEAVRKDVEQKHLNFIKNEINNGEDMDSLDFQKINQADSDKIVQAKPTEDEVKAALKVLNDAGINPYSQNPMLSSNPNQDYQNAQMAQINTLMGGNTQSGNASMLNMLPYMFSQNKSEQGSYSPQAMQAAILSTMMPNMNFNIDNDENK